MDKGLKILLDFYRTNDNFNNKPLTDEQKADFELAKSEGYMFDYPKPISHGEAMARLSAVLSKITRKDVSGAFLYSLSTRKLEYRSALGSYYFAAAVPPHEHTPNAYGECEVCGWRQWESAPDNYEIKHGLNHINFFRYKYGGVRMRLNEALFDLERFAELPKAAPRAEDFEILKKILKCVGLLAWKDRIAKLQRSVIREKILKTNSYEVENLLTALGICGVLADKRYPALEEKFVSCGEIKRLQFSEWDYPVNMWRAFCGVNKERLFEVFGIEYEEDIQCSTNAK